MFAIVMAGGSGTRLWPLSRRGSPKQLLALTGETSLLQQTVARLGNLLKPHDIYVITSQAHVRATQEQLPHLPPDNVLGEPLARSTAVAAGLATVLARRESDEVALVLPADHFVSNEGAFALALQEAARTAERGYLVALGVVPTNPATGYGYIKVGARLGRGAPTAMVRALRREADRRRRCRDAGRGQAPVERGDLRVAGLRLPAGARELPARAGGRARPDRGAAPHPGLDERGARCARAGARDLDRRRHRRAGGRRRADGGRPARRRLERHRLVVGPARGPHRQDRREPGRIGPAPRPRLRARAGARRRPPGGHGGPAGT